MEAPAGQVTSSLWGAKTSSVLPGTFELVLTDDLPNGPYGEMGMTGSGKVYVKPDPTYNDVAEALIAAWKKSRGSMMQMHMKGQGSVASSTYTEEWTIVSLEYKGGTVSPEQTASAGNHTVNLGLVQDVSLNTPACCVIL